MGMFDSIIQGLNEAVEYEKGNLKSARTDHVTVEPVIKYKSDEIKSIRSKLNLTQQSFASVMGVSKKTVEAWEAGKNTPEGSALRMLELLNKDTSLPEKYQILTRV